MAHPLPDAASFGHGRPPRFGRHPLEPSGSVEGLLLSPLSGTRGGCRCFLHRDLNTMGVPNDFESGDRTPPHKPPSRRWIRSQGGSSHITGRGWPRQRDRGRRLGRAAGQYWPRRGDHGRRLCGAAFPRPQHSMRRFPLVLASGLEVLLPYHLSSTRGSCPCHGRMSGDQPPPQATQSALVPVTRRDEPRHGATSATTKGLRPSSVWGRVPVTPTLHVSIPSRPCLWS